MDPQVVRTTYEPNGDVPDCPICGMPLSIRAKGQKEELPAGITARVQLSPERDPNGGHQDRGGRLSARGPADENRGLCDLRRERPVAGSSAASGVTSRSSMSTRPSRWSRRATRWPRSIAPNSTARPSELILGQAVRGLTRDLPTAKSSFCWASARRISSAMIAIRKSRSSGLMIRSPQNGSCGGKEDRGRRQRGGENDPFRVGRSLHACGSRPRSTRTTSPSSSPARRSRPRVEAYPNRTFQGELAAIYPRVEAATRTNRIRVRLDNPDNELRPGMFAAVTIDTPLETIEPYKTLAAKTARMILASHRSARHPSPLTGSRRGDTAANRNRSSLSCPSRPWSIRARRRSSMSSARRDCSRAWKSNWDRGRMISTRCSKG